MTMTPETRAAMKAAAEESQDAVAAGRWYYQSEVASAALAGEPS
jgi:hypothetical protein